MLVRQGEVQIQGRRSLTQGGLNRLLQAVSRCRATSEDVLALQLTGGCCAIHGQVGVAGRRKGKVRVHMASCLLCMSSL
jgi:hypothetical protein